MGQPFLLPFIRLYSRRSHLFFNLRMLSVGNQWIVIVRLFGFDSYHKKYGTMCCIVPNNAIDLCCQFNST